MTLTIDLTPDQEAKLQTEADASGMELLEFAKRRLLEGSASSAAGFRQFGTPEEEATDEATWDARFAASGDLLERLAAEADADHAAGRTRPLSDLLEKAG